MRKTKYKLQLPIQPGQNIETVVLQEVLSEILHSKIIMQQNDICCIKYKKITCNVNIPHSEIPFLQHEYIFKYILRIEVTVYNLDDKYQHVSPLKTINWMFNTLIYKVEYKFIREIINNYNKYKWGLNNIIVAMYDSSEQSSLDMSTWNKHRFVNVCSMRQYLYEFKNTN